MSELPQDSAFRLQQARIWNERTASYFGIAFGSLIGLFTIAHWTRKALQRSASNRSLIHDIARTVYRPFKRAGNGVLIGPVLLIPGPVVLTVLYLAVNIVLTFTNVDWSTQTFLARRMGWMTLLNLCLVVLLGLKNTPLSPLTGFSYESVKVLHRCCGYTTVVYVLLHAIIYATGLAKTGTLFAIRDIHEYVGAIAGVAMLILLITAITPMRKRQYELFYIVHITSAALILATAGYHVYHPPSPTAKPLIPLALAASCWLLDRSLRLARYLWYGIGNTCTLTPLSPGATRIVLHHSIYAAPGSHVFLWIPAVRKFQAHPFVLVERHPATFVVVEEEEGKDKFARELNEVARVSGGRKLRAAIEGPYGRVPDAKAFEKVVLIAGGGRGVAFTMALALDWVRSVRLRRHGSTMEFVWVVEGRDHLSPFEPELAELQASSAVNVSVYTTHKNPHTDTETSSSSSSSSHSPSSFSSHPPSSPPAAILEKHTKRPPPSKRTALPFWSTAAATQSSFFTTLSSAVLSKDPGRPNIHEIVEESVAPLSEGERVLVAVCGPSGTIAETRLATKACMKGGVADVWLHVEELGR